MLYRILCASLMLSLLIACQAMRPKSVAQACEADGFKQGTSEFDSCVQQQRAKDERLRSFQNRALSNRGGGR